MKVKTLVEQLSKINPDFDVEILVRCPNCTDKLGKLIYQAYDNVEIADIGYSSKIVLLSGTSRN